MFYVIVALWVVACAVSWLLEKIGRKYLQTSCPCVALGGLLAAVILYLLDQPAAAVIVLVAALYVWLTIRWAMSRQLHAKGIPAQ